MKNISSEKIFLGFKKILYRFPLAILFSVILTGYQLKDQSFLFFEESIMYITLMVGFIFSIIAQFVYEEFFEKKEPIRWGLYGLTLLIAGIYYMLASRSVHLVDDSWQIYSIPGIRTMIFYFTSLVGLIWVSTLKNKYCFPESFLIMFRALFITSFFSIVLYLGVWSIISLFEFLFFSLKSDWWTNISIIITNLFAPILFLSFLPEPCTAEESKEDEVKLSKFLYNLITYIFIPINAVLTGIIVVYIVTNLNAGFFRGSALETLILSYTISGWVLLNLADSITHTIAKWFKKIFPFSLIFVLVFQMIATFFQIQRIGITHGRYLILLFGIGSVISAVWYILKKHDLSLVPIVALVAGTLALIPPIDAVGVSVRTQRNHVNQLLEMNEVIVDSKKIVREAGKDVPEDQQKEIMESIRYLHGINALNQLEWLPEDYYYRTNEYLGFNISEETIDTPEDYEDINLYFGEEELHIETEGYSNLYYLLVDGENSPYKKEVRIDEEKYDLEVSFKDEFLLKFIPEEGGEEFQYDFTYILEDYKGKEPRDYKQDELTFEETDGDLTVQIIIQYMFSTDDYQDVQFYLIY